MKKFVTILFLIVSFAFSALAQESETVSPLFDTEVVRKVALMDIEGELFNNVVVTMKSISPDYLLSDQYRVKVTIKNAKGKKIWKETLNNVYLYVFSNGQVIVGKKHFDQILIYKSPETGNMLGLLREKEGIY